MPKGEVATKLLDSGGCADLRAPFRFRGPIVSIAVMRDSNSAALYGGAGLRPDFSHAKEATSGASIAELDISGMNIPANQNEQGLAFISVIALTNPIYFSVGPAGTPTGSNTGMTLSST